MLDWIAGGWQLGGIVTLQDGFPFTVECGGGTIQNGGGLCYPDPTGEEWQHAARALEFHPDGTARAVVSEVPQAITTPVTVTVTRRGKSKAITINGAGKIQLQQ